MNRDIFLTIIVPVYNVEKYLGRCLDSLVNQTCKDFRILIINDGSTDSSESIINNYKKKYPDLIDALNQKNSGLAHTRNFGLSIVDTKFVTFLDSDDWQEPMFVEKIKNIVNKYDEYPEIIFTLPWIYDDSLKIIYDFNDRFDFERIFYPNGGYESQESIVTNANKNPWIYSLEPNTNRRVYLTSFAKKINLQFSEGKKWEDVYPHFYALKHASRCIGMKNTGFYYRVNTVGQITAGTGATRLEIADVFKDTYDMAIENHFGDAEIAFIIKMLWRFTEWSTDVTNTETIDAFLRKMHELFNYIPYKYFKLYFNTCSPHRRTEIAKTLIIKSPFYSLLSDYRTRSFAKRFGHKIGGII